MTRLNAMGPTFNRLHQQSSGVTAAASPNDRFLQFNTSYTRGPLMNPVSESIEYNQ